MNVTEFKALKIGDLVKIVDGWEEVRTPYSKHGSMDKWLGQVAMVKERRADYIIIYEDSGDGPAEQGGHWRWFADMLEPYDPAAVASESESYIIHIPSNEDIISLLSAE